MILNPDTSPAIKPRSVHFSSASDEWATPQWLFESLNMEFGFTLDVCSTHENAKCQRHFTREEDGLKRIWAGEICWMNPPYGRTIKYWMAKAHQASVVEEATVVCLVPSRTDTVWWHLFAMRHEIRLLKGRLKFGDGTGSAPFPSALVVMRPASFSLKSFEVKPSESKNNH
jgi:site-specific DNA-methyltransferase (adenine-specific)